MILLTAFIVFRHSQNSSEEPSALLQAAAEGVSDIITKEEVSTTTVKTTSTATSSTATTTAVTTTPVETTTTTSVTTTPAATTTTATNTTSATPQGISVKPEYEDGITLKVGDVVNILSYLDIRGSGSITYLVDSDLYIRLEANGKLTAIAVGESTVAILQNESIESILKVTVE